jgi:hypothetical protein
VRKLYREGHLLSPSGGPAAAAALLILTSEPCLDHSAAENEAGWRG